MALAPTATAQDISYSGDPGDGGRYFLANVTFDVTAVGGAIATQEPLAALIGVANGLPVGSRIVGSVGWGGTAVANGAAAGLLMAVRGANLEFRSNIDMTLSLPVATVGVIHTFLCTR